VADTRVQRAVAMVLGAIDEPAVHAGSDGVRDGRRPHPALHVWRQRCLQDRLGWSIDAEVRACFDRLEPDLGCEVRTPRVNDGTIRRLIRTWRRAGGLAGEPRSSPARGSPQGGVRSPRRAQLVLEQGLDAWCARDVRPRMQGRGGLSRCADAGVIGCARAAAARRLLAVLPPRWARVTRTLPPQKTRVVRFQPPRRADDGARGDGTVDGRGLRHDWATARRGDWVITRRTAKTRLWRAMRAVWPWGRAPRPAPSRAPSRALGPKRRGHDPDDGRRGNARTRAAC
jgi:retron-type reverse transcriptase